MITKTYRLTLTNPDGKKIREWNMQAASMDAAMDAALKQPEVKNIHGGELSAKEVPEGPSQFGIRFRYYDTVFRQHFTDCLIIRAKNERQAKDYYVRYLEGGRFQHDPAKNDKNGKCIREGILEPISQPAPAGTLMPCLPLR